jgi:hypothetical protein
MTPRFAKVREIADRFRVSADSVYLWIRQGKIPSDCLIRIAEIVRVTAFYLGVSVEILRTWFKQNRGARYRKIGVADLAAFVHRSPAGERRAT